MTAPERRGRGRPPLPPEQQRQRLIDAAQRVLRNSGFEGASVQDIVGEAGMSSRSFYEFFRSKEELVLTLIEDASAAFMTRIALAFDPGRTADQVLDLALAAYVEELAPVVALDRQRLGAGIGERVEALRATNFARLMDLIMAGLQVARDRGVITRVPERVMLEIIVVGIEGLTVRYGREGRLNDLGEIRPALDRLLELLS